ncbi:MAG: diguanylate cyclase domain-containing protein [Campylobacterota bacterium]
MEKQTQKLSNALQAGFVGENEALLQEVQKRYKSTRVLDLDTLARLESIDFDIVFIVFKDKDIKKLFLSIVNLNLTVAVFTPFYNNLTFLKNALRYNVSFVENDRLESSALQKVFALIDKKALAVYEKQLQVKRHEMITNAKLQALIMLKHNKPVFINNYAKELLGIESKEEFARQYMEQNTPLLEVLFGKQSQKLLEIDVAKSGSQTFLGSSSIQNDSVIAALVPIPSALFQNKDSMLERIGFIEELKNAIAHLQVATQNSFCIVMASLSNFDSIRDQNGSYETFEFSKQIGRYIQQSVDNSALLASWQAGGFVLLVENRKKAAIDETLQALNNTIGEEVFADKIIPFLQFASISIDSQKDVNKTINIIDTFFSDGLSAEQARQYDYFQLSQISEAMDDTQKIYRYLSNIMYNNAPLKLLNIYKGVHISTTAFISKIENNHIYAEVKNVQLYAMQVEKSTVIQSVNLPKDLEVEVVHIDLKKSLAIFTYPRLLEYSANNRETTRVQSDFRFPAKIKQDRVVHSGEILDLSIKSIAVKLPKAASQQFERGDVWVLFRIPIESMDEGFFNAQIEGNLIKFEEVDERYVKAVIIFELDEPDESYLLEYIYNRQKEIIKEIKTIAMKGLAR